MRLITSKMARSILRSACALTVAAALSSGASAQSLRCKGDFAEIGNSKGTVLQKCGEPVLKDSFCKPSQSTISNDITPSNSTTGNVTNFTINQCVNVDEWTYNPGYGQFMTMLQFEGGQLKLIRYGDRVTR